MKEHSNQLCRLKHDTADESHQRVAQESRKQNLGKHEAAADTLAELDQQDEFKKQQYKSQ